MTGLTVRPAVVTDADDIARVHVRAWREAYTGRMPQEILDRLDETPRADGWRRILTGDFPGEESDVWVAVRDHEIIGFASSGRCRDADAAPGRIELFALYVLAAHYGSGAGQALLDAAIGAAPATLWVLDDNPRARAFYARNGFMPDGTVKLDDRWGQPIREIRLTRTEVSAAEPPSAPSP